MSHVHKVHDASGNAYTIPLANISHIIEANPYDQAVGVRQRIFLLNRTVTGAPITGVRVVETNAQTLNNQAGSASATGIVP